MYSYRYINQHYQFDCTEYTLILEDMENPALPAIRINKTFKLSPNEIDSNFLHEEAKKEISNIMTASPTEIVIVEES